MISLIDYWELINDNDIRFWKWYDNEMISLCKLINDNDNDIIISSINDMISLINDIISFTGC